MKCYYCPNPDKNLSMFYYTSTIIIIILTSVSLQGFFQEKIQDIVNGTIDDMNNIQKSHNIYPVIRKVLSATDFGNTKDQNLICPTESTSLCSSALINQLHNGMKFCCPIGFQCENIIGFDLENIKSRLSFIGCIQQTSAKVIAPSITSLEAVNCILLLGLIDSIPRFPNPISTIKEPIISNFKIVEDFFKYKLVDLSGMLAFISLSLIILFNMIDIIASVIPTKVKKYHNSTSTFSLTLSWLFYWSTNIEKNLPFSVLYCFSCLRISIFSILLTIPSFFAFYLSFEVDDYYLNLKTNNCFTDNLFGVHSDGVSFYISMMRRMKTSLIILFIFLLIRFAVFWHACLNYKRYMKAKEDRSFSEQFSVVEADDLIDADELRVQMSDAKYNTKKTKYDTDGESENETETLSFGSTSNINNDTSQNKNVVNKHNSFKKESPMEDINVRIETFSFAK